jgi:hypothetical protein
MARWIAVALAVALAVLAGCRMMTPTVAGSGKVVTEARPASGFRSVSVDGVGSATLVRGDQEGVVVETDDNLMQYITVEVRDGVLHLDTRNRVEPASIKPTEGIRFTVTFKTLEGIAVSGAGDATADVVEADRFDIAVSGAGDITVGRLKTGALNVAVSGAGDLSLAGEAGTQRVAISGTGAYRAGDLRSASAAVAISGTGDATVWCTDSLEARVSGVGSISYYGEPSVTKSISGMGDVTALGMHGTSI